MAHGVYMYVNNCIAAELHFELHLKWKGNNGALVGGRSGADNTL